MTKNFAIEVETHDKSLGFEMFDTKSLGRDTQVVLSDGTVVKFEGTLIRKSLGIPEVVHAAVDIGKDIGVGIVASWIYDKLKGKQAKLRINRREIEISADKIRVAIEEIENDG